MTNIIPLSNFDIEHYYNADNRFKGCVSKNNVKQLPKNSFMVLNMDKPSGNGTHWVSFMRLPSGKYIYYDSFGVPPPKKANKIIKGKGVYSTFQVQDIESSACGYHAIYVIDMLFNEGKSFLDILFDFDKHSNDNNDKKVLNHYSKKLKNKKNFII